jgi:AraC family transcriptional regulator, regulatory protein of adaptative response / methylated-DNA-[protein]-cysteine methyltransferase
MRNPVETAEDPRWKSVVNRERNADGDFFYAVITTGVFCRPACAARLARFENVRFFDSASAAEAAGFRPCKRCRPTDASLSDRQNEIIVKVCRTIEQSPSLPSLAELSAIAGMSPHHFHRLFKSLTGVTPKKYAEAFRAGQMRVNLAQASNITDAIYASGYGSSSRFYERADETLGMTARAFKSGAPGLSISYAIAPCSLGLALVAQTRKGVCAIFLGDNETELTNDLQSRFHKAKLTRDSEEMRAALVEIVALIEQPSRPCKLPLDIMGTAFQQRVWDALRKIPAGSTMTYSKLASAIGSPSSTRAVASACGANPIAVAVPCHRVMGTDGKLHGYRWGLERKLELRKREENEA